MDIWGLVVLPLGFGLIGFITPCSLGVNLILLGYIAGRKRRQRLLITSSFTLVRALFLSVMGFTLALLGRQFMSFESAYKSTLGLIFMGLGVWIILGQIKPLPIPSFLSMKNPKPRAGLRGVVGLGIAFGFTVPACDMPFLMALLSKTVLTGNLQHGLVALLIFGLGTSFPLIIIGSFNSASNVLLKLKKGSATAVSTGGAILVFAGLLNFSPDIMSFVFSIPARFLTLF